jgi:hypothetical protein
MRISISISISISIAIAIYTVALKSRLFENAGAVARG